MTGRLRLTTLTLCASSIVLLLAGCGSSAPSLPALPSIFGESDEAKLPGERKSVRAAYSGSISATAESKETVALPAPQENASWSQPGGSVTYRVIGVR